jgi:hypothetical protein
MEARGAEMALLDDTTGLASKLRRTNEATLRKLRHADEDAAAGRLQSKGKGKKGVNGHA